MIRGIKIYLTIAMSLIYVMAYSITPEQALQKAKNKITSAQTVSADFKMNIGQNSATGKIQTKGKKFVITSNLSSSWYDGASLYTYNPGTAETTTVKPDSSELLEANPLLYINSTADYKITGTKQKKNGLETVVLLPKKSGTGVKSITINLNSSSFLPSSIEINPVSGSKITITLSNVKLNISIADSQFVYPKTKYPNAKIIDLR